MGFLMILGWDTNLISFFCDKDMPSKFLYLKQLTMWIAHSRASPGCRTLTLAWTRALPVRCPVPSGILKWVNLSTSDSFKTPYNMWCIWHMVLMHFSGTQALSQFEQHVVDVAGVDEFAPARSLDVQGVFVADSCSWTTCLLFPCVWIHKP